MSDETWKDTEGKTHYGNREYYEKTNGTTINLKINKSKAMEKLEEENQDLKAKLTIIAEKEFNRRKDGLEAEAKKLNLDVSIENPSDLKAVQKIIEQNQENKTRRSSRDIPLNAHQFGNATSSLDNQGKPVLDRSYENLNQLFSDLEKEHRENNPESTKILHQLTKKSAQDLVNGSVYEFTGRLTKTAENENEKLKWRKVR